MLEKKHLNFYEVISMIGNGVWFINEVTSYFFNYLKNEFFSDPHASLIFFLLNSIHFERMYSMNSYGMDEELISPEKIEILFKSSILPSVRYIHSRIHCYMCSADYDGRFHVQFVSALSVGGGMKKEEH